VSQRVDGAVPGDPPSRVCILTSRVDLGAFANVAVGLADGFDRLGMVTDLLFLEGDASDRLPPTSTQRRLGGRSRTSFIGVARHLRATRPDLLISLGWLLNTPAVLGARLARTSTRVLLNEASILSYKARVEHRRQLQLRLIPFLARRLYPHADGLGAVSQAVIDDLRQVVGVSSRFPMRVVPNPVDAERVRRLARGAVRPVTRPIRFVNIGRLARQKNHALLIDAYRLLEERGLESELTIIGSGPLAGQLQQQARRLELDVRFVPYLANPFVELAEADVFVLSSEEEGFGLVLVEAMALGVPIVATDCPGGVREVLLDGKAGDLVPPGDAVALADAMYRCATDLSRRASMAAAGLARAEDFAPATIAARWRDFAIDLSTPGVAS
jgi:glycosyltransferase involved in cell wall biosynthesis